MTAFFCVRNVYNMIAAIRLHWRWEKIPCNCNQQNLYNAFLVLSYEWQEHRGCEHNSLLYANLQIPLQKLLLQS